MRLRDQVTCQAREDAVRIQAFLSAFAVILGARDRGGGWGTSPVFQNLALPVHPHGHGLDTGPPTRVLAHVMCHVSCAQACLTLCCDPMYCSLPASSVNGIFQARILEWASISFSRGSSQPTNRTQVSCVADRRCFTV